MASNKAMVGGMSKYLTSSRSCNSSVPFKTSEASTFDPKGKEKVVVEERGLDVVTCA